MDKRIKKYGKYAYNHLYEEDINDFKLDFPYAYGTIDGFTYKVHLEEMIKGIPKQYTKEMYDKDFFNNGKMSFSAVEWSDMMDLDNRFLLCGEIIDVKLGEDSIEYKLVSKLLNDDKNNFKEVLDQIAYILKDLREKAMDIGYKQGIEQGVYLEQERLRRLKNEK